MEIMEHIVKSKQQFFLCINTAHQQRAQRNVRLHIIIGIQCFPPFFYFLFARSSSDNTNVSYAISIDHLQYCLQRLTTLQIHQRSFFINKSGDRNHVCTQVPTVCPKTAVFHSKVSLVNVTLIIYFINKSYLLRKERSISINPESGIMIYNICSRGIHFHRPF